MPPVRLAPPMQKCATTSLKPPLPLSYYPTFLTCYLVTISTVATGLDPRLRHRALNHSHRPDVSCISRPVEQRAAASQSLPC
ncbi:hypothetical protein BS50DRAFT_71259 [Corynespora cassiicola Philippines]|uniref:Uncharacterized protein n=1 Tax=Corynespora cassiicola Philippines TaxID=1448308 RepID=A0A2T2NFY5_CORCC|nr:hypothetical protein BS50DRAFT_71259 [Corynespora cassiicola Philippines]